MCVQKIHMCLVCGKEYSCEVPGWACPTLNGDETRNLCPAHEIIVTEELCDEGIE